MLFRINNRFLIVFLSLLLLSSNTLFSKEISLKKSANIYGETVCTVAVEASRYGYYFGVFAASVPLVLAYSSYKFMTNKELLSTQTKLILIYTFAATGGYGAGYLTGGSAAVLAGAVSAVTVAPAFALMSLVDSEKFELEPCMN